MTFNPNNSPHSCIYYENDIDAKVAQDMKGCDLAIDTESMGLKPLRDKLCVIQLSTGDGIAHVIKMQNPSFDCPNIKSLLDKTPTQKIIHFARADILPLQYYLGIKMHNVYCTKIASRIARTFTNKHGLKDLCYDLLGVRISKQQQTSDWGGVLSQEQIDYAGSDVLYLHQIRDILNRMLKRENRYDLAIGCFEFLSTRVALDQFGWKNGIMDYHYDDSGDA